jgi:hypothetical protein
MRRVLTTLAIAACLLVQLSPQAHGDHTRPESGARVTGPGNVDLWSGDEGDSGGDGSGNTRTAAYDPDAYMCRYVPQINEGDWEHVAEQPAGSSSGQSMNQICGRAAEVLAAMGQANPSKYFMDNCVGGEWGCGALYGVWVENAQPTPRELAQMLRESLQLHAPDAVRTSPVPNRLFVRFPTWFWLEGGPGVAEPISKATPDGVVKVEAVPAFEWSTGEGVVTCPDKGTPYDAARYDAGAESPTCGHTYARPGRYTLTVTVTWTFTWYLNGNEQGQLPATNYSVSADIAVNEIQGIVTDVR